MPNSANRRLPKPAKASLSTPQLDQVSPNFYTDGETALEAGTELEEKAERFAIGWKAEKYYEKSLAMYRRALQLDRKSQDAPYNCARVLFILATDFYTPPKSIEALQESASLYRQSLSLTSPTESTDDVPSAFYLDVQFNLAVTLLALADQYEQSKEEEAARVNVINEAIMQFNSVINGQELVLHRQKMAQETDEESNEEAEMEMPDAILQSAEEVDHDKQSRSEYTTSLITPASALETLFNLHLSALALLDVVTDTSLIQGIVQLSRTSSQRAQAIYVAFPDGERRSPDNEWSENVASLRFATLDIRIAELSKTTTLGTGEWSHVEQSIRSTGEDAIREAGSLLLLQSSEEMDLSTTVGRSRHRTYSQHLEHLGDLLLTLSRSILFYVRPCDDDQLRESMTSLSQQAWALLGSSSKLFLAALHSLDTSSAAGAGTSAVLGAHNASTTATRRRCSLYTSLSVLSLLRSDARFYQSVPNLSEKTREQLLNNGRIYGRKAVTEVGLGWLLTGDSSSSSAASGSQYNFPHGGLDSLRGEVDAILTLLRALYLRSAVLNDNAQEVKVVCSNVKRGLLEGKCGPTWKWLLFHPEGLSQGAGLLEQVIGEEGEAAVTMEERHFWSQVESSLL
ncbi:hypothetical protein CBS101457_006471 [Exobasidium rhododendri]|nr:hypothetical protein CBS101457_006471 [Exobasidium rhododendri]